MEWFSTLVRGIHWWTVVEELLYEVLVNFPAYISPYHTLESLTGVTQIPPKNNDKICYKTYETAIVNIIFRTI